MQPRQSMLGAVLHCQGSGRERFFGERLELRSQAGLALCENPQSLDGGAANYVRGIIVERHQQASHAHPLRAGVSDAGGHQSEVRAGSPVVAAALAEESDQSFGVRFEQCGLLFDDAPRRIRGALAKPFVAGEQRLQQRSDESGAGENLRGRALCALQPPGTLS